MIVGAAISRPYNLIRKNLKIIYKQNLEEK